MEEFKIEVTQLKRCDLVTLAGRIDSSKSPQVEETLKGILANGRFRVVLDMSAVEYVSSAFLRVLISASKSVRRFNRGDIYLAALSGRIKDVFDLAGLLPLFKLYDTQVEAVGSW